MNILEKIVASKRIQVEERSRQVPLDELKRATEAADARRPFRALFERGPVLIAELKPKSPSAGVLITERSPLEVADLYGKSAADAISVLTDEEYFGGSLQLLKDVRARVPQPILRKDFIIDEYQLYESRAAGADAALLIAGILPGDELKYLIAVAQSLSLDTLVEVHDEGEMERAVDAGATLIGINNRDLTTMQVDLATTERLAPRAPREIFVVSESGIATAQDARRVRAAGARGILVGTSVLRSGNILEKIAELKASLV